MVCVGKHHTPSAAERADPPAHQSPTMVDEPFRCDTCDRTVTRGEAIRRETMGGLDPEKWQTFCCPDCGRRLQTVYVGDE